jgi:hypothetical protein
VAEQKKYSLVIGETHLTRAVWQCLSFFSLPVFFLKSDPSSLINSFGSLLKGNLFGLGPNGLFMKTGGFSANPNLKPENEIVYCSGIIIETSEKKGRIFCEKLRMEGYTIPVISLKTSGTNFEEDANINCFKSRGLPELLHFILHPPEASYTAINIDTLEKIMLQQHHCLSGFLKKNGHSLSERPKTEIEDEIKQKFPNDYEIFKNFLDRTDNYIEWLKKVSSHKP